MGTSVTAVMPCSCLSHIGGGLRWLLSTTNLTGNLISLTICIRLSLLPVNPLQVTAQTRFFFGPQRCSTVCWEEVLSSGVETLARWLTCHILLGHAGSLSLSLSTHKEDVWIPELVAQLSSLCSTVKDTQPPTIVITSVSPPSPQSVSLPLPFNFTRPQYPT